MNATRRVLAVMTVVGLVALAGCGRSGKSASGDSGGSTQASGSGSFGSMKNVCGKGKGTNTASDRGVTANSIDLGVISDAGFTGTPGLNQELWDASDVFVKWCNAQGGIYGRQLKANHLDAALTQFKQQVLVACQSDFSLVGGGGVFDDTGQEARLGCLMPNFPGFLTSGKARGSALQWQQLPSPNDQLNIGLERWLTAKFPSSIDSVGYLTANVPTTIVTVNQLREAGKTLGWKETVNQQYAALGEATWIPVATKLKNSGVKGVVFVGEPTVLAKLEAAMTAIDYKPTWIFASGNTYDKAFISAVGSQVVNTYVPINNYPFEQAIKKVAGSEAMQQYLALFQQYLPNGKAQTLLGVDAFAAWLLFAQGANTCGNTLTRKCIYNAMQKVTSFDGGGITAPANPASQQTTACYGVVQATPTGFVLQDVQPTAGVFNCDKGNVLTLTGDYGHGVTLADVGKSLSQLP